MHLDRRSHHGESKEPPPKENQTNWSARQMKKEVKWPFSTTKERLPRNLLIHIRKRYIRAVLQNPQIMMKNL